MAVSVDPATERSAVTREQEAKQLREEAEALRTWALARLPADQRAHSLAAAERLEAAAAALEGTEAAGVHRDVPTRRAS